MIVSPLSRYYASLLGYLGGSIAIFLVTILGLRVDPGTAILVMAAFTIVFATYINSKFGIRCPNCGLALGFMKTPPNLAGLPGRHCTRCHADLSLVAPP
jgi:hypothetical protein